MAWTVSYQTKRGTRHKVCWRDPSGDQQSKGGFKTLRVARSFKTEIEAALLQRELGALHPQTDILLEEMIRKMFATRAYRDWWLGKADYFAFTPLFSDIADGACHEQEGA